MVDAIGNLAYVVTALCAVVGFLVIWRQITVAREAEHRRKQLIVSASLAGAPVPSHDELYPSPDACREWKERAQRAETLLADMEDQLREAERLLVEAHEVAETMRADAAENEAALMDDATQGLDGCEEGAAIELGHEIADAVQEAERHWSAGLDYEQRRAAWAEHWSHLDPRVLEAIREQSEFWESVKFRRARRSHDN